MKEQLKAIKSTIINLVQGQMNNLQCVDTEELGQAIDIIKDLEESLYYCTIIEAMEKQDQTTPQNNYYYTEHPIYYRDMDKENGRMYYSGSNSGSQGGSNNSSSSGNSSNSDNSSNRYYTEREMPLELRDYREGKSPISRKSYMEAKELHQDKTMKIKELEKYMQELSNDLVEMAEGASPEEKQLMQKKMAALATKIGQ